MFFLDPIFLESVEVGVNCFGGQKFWNQNANAQCSPQKNQKPLIKATLFMFCFPRKFSNEFLWNGKET